jgi:hypothetical protein
MTTLCKKPEKRDETFFILCDDKDYKMNSRQLGKIKLDSKFFKESPAKILKVFISLSFVPYQIKETETNIEYIGVCPDFKEVPLGSVIPEYDLNINAYNFKGTWDIYNIFATPEAKSFDGVITWEEKLDKDTKEFEDIYGRYVIRETNSSYFIGASGNTCVFRSNAKRFTKKEAMKFINENLGDFVIEDAK